MEPFFFLNKRPHADLMLHFWNAPGVIWNPSKSSTKLCYTDAETDMADAVDSWGNPGRRNCLFIRSVHSWVAGSVTQCYCLKLITLLSKHLAAITLSTHFCVTSSASHIFFTALLKFIEFITGIHVWKLSYSSAFQPGWGLDFGQGFQHMVLFFSAILRIIVLLHDSVSSKLQLLGRSPHIWL